MATQTTSNNQRTLAIALIIVSIIACLLPTGSSNLTVQTNLTTSGRILLNQPPTPTPAPTTTPQPTPTPSPSPTQNPSPNPTPTNTPTPTTQPTPTPIATPPPINTQALKGLSGYPTSTNQINNIISVMQTNGLNLYRMSFNPTWMSGPHPYHAEYIQYFLDHTPSNWIIIVDRNHIYPPTEQGAATFRTNLDVARNSILAVCQAWPNNPRVWVEMGNEYVSTDFHTVFQGLINDVRNAGYTNTLVIDKWNTAWSTAVFNDPYDSVYVGMHFYFNSWSVSGAISQMKTAQNLGLKLVNTEVGADFNEASSFTSSTVDELNDFLRQSEDLGVGNTVWMNENLANWARYQQLSLVFP